MFRSGVLTRVFLKAIALANFFLVTVLKKSEKFMGNQTRYSEAGGRFISWRFSAKNSMKN